MKAVIKTCEADQMRASLGWFQEYNTILKHIDDGYAKYYRDNKTAYDHKFLRHMKDIEYWDCNVYEMKDSEDTKVITFDANFPGPKGNEYRRAILNDILKRQFHKNLLGFLPRC